ncbi:MAG: aspartate/glutamate racemase family protein [Planctomycetaceae bacterium]|nr:aspartate/glutamate racemase family protein [Planctomycetaceae bacterium]
MKIAVVYTSTTPKLVAGVTDALQAELAGMPAEILSYQDASILQEARDNNGLTPGLCARLLDLYEQGRRDGADIILNICSSVGEVARRAKPLYELCGIPFIRIDEDMARAAVAAGARIGVVATLPTTLNPTKELVQQCADAAGKKVELVDALADGAFGLDQDGFRQKLIDTGRLVADRVDVLLFAQGSMAYAEGDVAAALGKPVFSSIRFGAKAVAEAAKKR